MKDGIPTMLPNTYRKLTNETYAELWGVYDRLKLFIKVDINDNPYLQEVLNNLHSTLLTINKIQIIKENEDEHKDTPANYS